MKMHIWICPARGCSATALCGKGIRRAGAGKFLFGTDYPITNPGMYVHAVLGEHIGEEDRRLIFSGNAKRLLRLMPEAL